MNNLVQTTWKPSLVTKAVVSSLPDLVALPGPALFHSSTPYSPLMLQFSLYSSCSFSISFKVSVNSGWDYLGTHIFSRVRKVIWNEVPQKVFSSHLGWEQPSSAHQVLSGLGGISGQSPGLACSADPLPRREGPKASSASTLVAQRAPNTFLIDSLNCSDMTGMEVIRSSGLMPESRDKFPPQWVGKTWDPGLELSGREHYPSSLAIPSFPPVLPFCVTAFVLWLEGS